MDTVKVDIRKLQTLNDRINQCIDALGQVRLSVHGLSHCAGAPRRGLEGPEATLATLAPDGGWAPPVTVWEDDRELVVCLDVAGARREDLRLTVDGNRLTVEGQRPVAFDGLRLRLAERPLGTFARRFVFSTPLAGEPQARLELGLLEIRLAKAPGLAPERREIPVR